MRIDLDNGLDKVKLRQALKMIEGKKIKIVCGSEIYDIDTITSSNGVIYFHTDSRQTVNSRLKKNKDDLRVKTNFQGVYEGEDWEEYKKKRNFFNDCVGDIPGHKNVK